MVTQKTITLFSLILIGILAAFSWLEPGQYLAAAQDTEAQYTTDFALESCDLLMPFSSNPYFVLNPGYQLILEGEEDGETIRVAITALDDIELIDLEAQGIGLVPARVIEEWEWTDGELIEVSRNFFAQCFDTGAVYYFGETVDIFENGELVRHEGAWRAGEAEAMPGMIMPGVYLLGSRYFQEIAPGVALDRAENVAMGQKITTAAGSFSNCVTMRETSALDPDDLSIKAYCHGVGLVIDDALSLVDYGLAGNSGDDIDDEEDTDEAGDIDENDEEDEDGSGEEEDNDDDEDE